MSATSPLPVDRDELFGEPDYLLVAKARVAVLLLAGTGIRPARQSRGGNVRVVDAEALEAHVDRHGHVVRIGVWRDPVERLMDAYQTWCVGGRFHRYIQMMDLYGASLERFVEFAEFELGKRDPRMQAAPVRRQHDAYGHGAVDRVMSVDGLTEQLSVRSRRGPQIRTDPTPRPPEQLATRIRTLYAKDLELRPTSSMQFGTR